MSLNVIVTVQRTFRWRQCVHRPGDRLLMPVRTAKQWADRHVVMLSAKDRESVQTHQAPMEDLCLEKVERSNFCVRAVEIVRLGLCVVNTVRLQSFRVAVGIAWLSIERMRARLNGRALIMRADSSRDL